MSSRPVPGNPPDESESARLRALQAYGLLDSAPEPGFDALTRLAARLLGTPIALISLVDAERLWFKSRVGLDVSETSRDIAFCDHAIRGQGLMVVDDAHQDPRFADSPLVTDDPHIRFYAGAPLRNAEGWVLGALCVIDHQPRSLSEEDRALLQDLAAQVLVQMELRRQNQKLQAALLHIDRDHRELQTAQLALTRSEARLREVLHETNDGWWEFELGSRGVYLSPRAEQMLGYPEGALQRDRSLLRRLLPDDQRHAVSAAIAAVLAGRHSALQLGVELLHRHGERVPMLLRGYATRDAGGRTQRLTGTLTDLRPIRRAERERSAVELRFQALYQHSLDGVLLSEPSRLLLAANPAACRLLGYSEAELTAMRSRDLLDPSDPRGALLLRRRDLQGQARGEMRLLRRDGSAVEVEMAMALYQDEGGRQLASIVLRDLGERRQMQAQRRADLALLDSLSCRVPGLLCQYRRWPDGRSAFPFASAGIREIYELEPEAVRDDGSAIFERIHPDDADRILRSIEESARSLKPWCEEYRVLLPERGLRWLQGEAKPDRLDDGSVVWHGFISDISARKADERQMFRLAHIDTLTGLANRHSLMARLEDFVSAARRHRHGGALLFIDLDNFKQINDARGHATGDRVLRWASERLLACVRREDLVARLGGDEFVVVLGDLSVEPARMAAQAQTVAAKICERLAEPQCIEGVEWAGSASVGISLFPKPDHGPDDLLREADIAMYEAKGKGRNGWAIFERDMQTAVEERLTLQADLRRALELEQFEVHVQAQTGPQGELRGAELLLRWRHPVRGWVPPTQFIPLAEDTGLIVPLGDWVLRQAAQTLVALEAAGLGSLSLSVNVSPRQFHEAGFVERLELLLRDTGARPKSLVLEITEGLLLLRSDEVLARMRALAAQGLRFSIDDFGTGYSSLAYLQSMPLYEVKIDRGFVSDVPGDRGDTAIVQSILSMSRHLGLHVVAEGVETAEQAAFLVAHGCDALQGYWLHRPQPLTAWLAAQGVVKSPREESCTSLSI